MVNSNKPRKIRLSANPTPEALADLTIGDIVYLDGAVYTAREGIYKRVLEDGIALPLDLPEKALPIFIVHPPRPNMMMGVLILVPLLLLRLFGFPNGLAHGCQHQVPN